MQAGTELTNGGLTKPFVQIWKKGYPSAPSAPHKNLRAPMNIHSGDTLEVILKYSPAKERLYTTFFDRSTMKMRPEPITEDVSKAQYFNGSAVTWSEERPRGFANGNLKNFGTVPWSHVKALYGSGGGTWAQLAFLPTPERFVMREHETVLARTEEAGGTAQFADHYFNCKE